MALDSVLGRDKDVQSGMIRLWAIGPLVNCILRWAECMGLFIRSSRYPSCHMRHHIPQVLWDFQMALAVALKRSQAERVTRLRSSTGRRHKLHQWGSLVSLTGMSFKHLGLQIIVVGWVSLVDLLLVLSPVCHLNWFLYLLSNVFKTLPRSWMWNDVRNQICRANGDHEAVSVAAPHVSSIVAAQEYVAQRLATRKPTERLGEHVEQLRLFSKESFMFWHSTSNTWISRGFSCCCSALQTWSLVLRSSLLALTPGSTSRKSDDGTYGDQPANAWWRFIPICSQYWKSSNCAASVCFIWPSVVQMSFDLTEYMVPRSTV